jgi:hypothetical protein
MCGHFISDKLYTQMRKRIFGLVYKYAFVCRKAIVQLLGIGIRKERLPDESGRRSAL